MSGPRIGIIGGGQLARMMQQAAIPLGIELVVLADDGSAGAATAIPNTLVGSPDDESMIRRLADQTDVVTVDHEVLDLDLMRRFEAEGMVLRPGASTLAVAADKVAQKHAFAVAGLPAAEHMVISGEADLTAAFSEWGDVVLKLARGGYDGRGVWVRPSRDEALDLIRRFQGSDRVLLAERPVTAEMEIAVLVARRPSGESVTYDPVKTLQVDGMCREVVAPAGLDFGLRFQAMQLAAQVATAVGTTGVMAVEMFIEGDSILLNEIAPRPHNSGHHTIEAAITSQFSNHLRAVLDLPLGSPALRSPAVTVNVVGSVTHDDPRLLLAEGLAADSAAAIHLYDKAPRLDRKIGHVTVCDDDPEGASKRAWAVVTALGGDVRR